MMNLCRNALFLFLLSLSTAVGAASDDLYRTAEAGLLDSVKAFLEQDPSLLESADEGGYTPLHKAAYAGQVEVVRYLLGVGANVSAASNSGSTPLHGAAYYGHWEAVEALLGNGADVNAPNAGGYTPLLSAMAGEHAGIMRYLIEHGADPGVTTGEGQTALMMAAQSNDRELTELILSRGPDLEAIDSYGRTALLLVARESGSTEAAKLLIDAGADMNVKDNFGSTPLELASWRGFSGVVNLLLDLGAEFPTDGDRLTQMLTYSAERSLPRLFGELVARGGDVATKNPNDGSYLHSAAEGGNAEIVRGLLRQGLQVNEHDKYGWTALHYAASRDRLEVARALLDNDSEINATTRAGHTALDLARDRERPELIELLLQNGAEEPRDDFVELKGAYFGQTPPGDTPIWFAPDIVSSHRFEHSNVAFAPHGNEAFWSSSFCLDDSGYSYSRMLTSRVENGRWTKPSMAPFSGVKLGDDSPFYSPDGARLYFVSSRPIDEGDESSGFHLWVVDRILGGWSEPHLAPAGLNEIGDRSYRSMAASGNVYASGKTGDYRNSEFVLVSRPSDSGYLAPVDVGGQVNSTFDEHACVSPDESLMIIKRMGHPNAIGDADLFASFRDEDGNWTTPLILPEPINSSSRDWYPSITLDGKYLIFNSHRGGGADYYWVSISAVTALRDTALRLRHATRPAGDGFDLRRTPQEFEPSRTIRGGIGDLDGDGDLDVICANMGSSGSRVWLNDGKGVFVATDQSLTLSGHGVALADIDTDGDIDMFIVCNDKERNSKLYLNDGSARFEDSGVNPGDSMLNGTQIEIHDLDGDSDLDVVIKYYQEDDVAYLNDGHNCFTRSSLIIPKMSTWGDLDGDGHVDILARDLGVGFQTYLNDGSGNFSVQWEKLDSTVARGSIELGDLDGDGDLDAVVVRGGNGASPTELWYNDGEGRFDISATGLPGVYTGRFALGDLNGDGYADLFVTNLGMPDYVWLNDGHGGLEDTGLRLGGCAATINPTLGDLDGDGDLDIFAPNFSGGPNVIWFNERN